jgi:Uma2 family endonuclease
MDTIATESLPQIENTFSPPSRRLYRMTMQKYEAMVQSGLFTKHDRFHLVEGLLVAKMTVNPPHASVCGTTEAAIQAVLPGGWHLRVDKPLRIPSRISLPEPDIVVTRGTSKDYLKRHPEPADVALVVEVADSSLDEDRTMMLRAYGGGGVVRYWIVNLDDRQVEVYSQPSGAAEPIGYRHCEVFRPGQQLPVVIGEAELGLISVTDLVP